MLTLDEARERVHRGALMLDTRHPKWEKKIHVGELNMNNCQYCILGQLTGDFWNAGISGDLKFAEAHGFISPKIYMSWDDYLATKKNNYTHLTTAWKEEIAKRRKIKE